MMVMIMIFLYFLLVFGYLVYEIVVVKSNKGWFVGMFMEVIVIFMVFKY